MDTHWINDAFSLYALAYAASTAHVLYDANRRQQNQIESPLELTVQRYQLQINHEQKDLTLVGENHYYTKAEQKFAEELVEEHEYIATETGLDISAGISFPNLLYNTLLLIPLSVNHFYLSLALNRNSKSIGELLNDADKYIFPLEESISQTISDKTKIKLLSRHIICSMLGPIIYYQTKNSSKNWEKEEDNSPIISTEDKEIVQDRDTIMAGNILNIFNNYDIDKLLAVVGRAHVPGIITSLSQKVELTSVKGLE